MGIPDGLDAYRALSGGFAAPADDPARYPLARTIAEAELYISLQPCHVCRERALDTEGFDFDERAERVRLFRAVCGDCRALRRFWFRFPVEPVPTGDGHQRFGGPQASELLDPGEWMIVADDLLASVPADPRGLTAERAGQAWQDADAALAAVEEVLKFLGPGEDRIPPAAFRSAEGGEVWRTGAWRFERAWLDSQLEICRNTLAAYPRG
ncbi:MAG TPA: hypothetical protein VJT31_07235 [Rugosimonospora sp.]|nr:hypothetical protein [Rugosimonospora sp.]